MTDHLTHSMIRDYLRCPRLYYYRYYLGIRLPSKHLNLVFGSAIHEGIEDYYNRKDPIYAFTSDFQIDKIDNITKDEYLNALKEGKRLLDFFTAMIPITRGSSEVKFRTELIDPITHKMLEVPITGRYDRLEDNMIIEFKTSSKPYKQKDIDEATQASLYMFARYMATGKIPERFRYIILIKGRKKEPIQVLETQRTKEDLSFMFRTIETVLEGIKGEQFSKGTGFMHNKFCDCQKYEQELLL